MKSCTPVFALFCGGMLLLSQAHAESKPETAAGESEKSGPRHGDASLVLGQVEVNERAHGALAASTMLISVDVIGHDKLEDKQAASSWELLGLLPGIQLTMTGQGAESGKATLRAFNGEGYINGIKTLIDGIPSNVNSGNQRFIDMIFPLEIEYIEVVRGTNDPRYGLHNIGGNVNYGTRQGGDYLDARLGYGSFNTREAQLAYGYVAGPWEQNYFLGVRASDGYRQHADAYRHTLAGKWFYTSDDQNIRAGLVARSYCHDAQESGFMTAQELAANRRASAPKNANDGDDRDMWHLGLHLDMHLGPALDLSTKAYVNSYRDDRKVTFTDYPTGNAPRQRRQWDERQTGVLASLTWNAAPEVLLELAPTSSVRTTSTDATAMPMVYRRIFPGRRRGSRMMMSTPSTMSAPICRPSSSRPRRSRSCRPGAWTVSPVKPGCRAALRRPCSVMAGFHSPS